MNNVTSAVYIFILRVLFVILKNRKVTCLEENFQIDSEVVKSEFFKSINLSETLKREKIFKTLFGGLEKLCKSDNDISFDGITTLRLAEIRLIQNLSLNKFFTGTYPEVELTSDLEGEVMFLLEQCKIKGNDPLLNQLDIKGI